MGVRDNRVPLARPLLGELRAELPVTVELLRRLPEAKLAFRPHERSMTLGRLASHIAECVKYGWQVLERDRIDSASPSSAPLDLGEVDAIVAAFEEHAARFERALSAADDEHLLSPWQYCKGETVLFDTRRISALRRLVLDHLIHHRGQLSVYLRLLDVPLPQIYGPSADDRRGY